MKEKKRVPTDDQSPLRSSPFKVLKNLNVPPIPVAKPIADPVKKLSRGRVDILRQTAHRGGKTVTVVTNFVGVGPAEQKQLAKEMQKACGAGGTVKDGRIEIQGDHRQTVARILTEAGFRTVMAGG
jgi:translation initiation factor 1